jgi:hypothetical protein
MLMRQQQYKMRTSENKRKYLQNNELRSVFSEFFELKTGQKVHIFACCMQPASDSATVKQTKN